MLDSSASAMAVRQGSMIGPDYGRGLRRRRRLLRYPHRYVLAAWNCGMLARGHDSDDNGSASRIARVERRSGTQAREEVRHDQGESVARALGGAPGVAPGGGSRRRSIGGGV